MDEAFRSYYERGDERERLSSARGTLELARTLELLERVLPPPPADVLDVGGGPGTYAAILAERGYRVKLVDIVPLHVEQAREHGTFEAALGDARSLDEPDAGRDVVLLLGPLYHLTERADRVRALAEARRAVRPGGLVAAAAISRLASLFDALAGGKLADPAIAAVVARDLADGQHRTPDPLEPKWFTTAFFHHPDELEAEVRDAGLKLEGLLGVEGPGYWFGAPVEEALLAARATESDPAARATSAHLLAIARRR